MGRTRMGAAALAALALLAAGCGGGDERAAGSSSDTSASAAGTSPAPAPAEGTDDVISVIALSDTPGQDITVSIGDYSTTVSASGTAGKASFYETSFAGHTGAVSVTAGGKAATGPSISADCPSTGQVNFNAVSFQV